MINTNISPSILLTLVLIAVMLGLSLFEARLMPHLGLYAEQVRQGDYWRLLSANFLHFGWAHSLTNLTAFLLCGLAFFAQTPIKKYSLLLILSCLAVGLGIFLFNPHYSPYAGLSGVLHGLIVAGLLQTKGYALWLRVTGLCLVTGKLVRENLPGYQATDLQQLIPAAVAVEAHLYGAAGGILFCTSAWLIHRLRGAD